MTNTLPSCYRHCSKSLPKKPICNHPPRFGFKCSELGMQDIRKFHQLFYESHNKICQDQFILRFVTLEPPKRKRPRSGTTKNKSKGVTMRYYMPTFNHGKRQLLQQVCQNTFASVLNISKFRIQRLGKEQLRTGTSPRERRGGDTRSRKYEAKVENVKKFIESLVPIESHYSRGKFKRQYLSSDLSIKGLWRIYSESILCGKVGSFCGRAHHSTAVQPADG